MGVSNPTLIVVLLDSFSIGKGSDIDQNQESSSERRNYLWPKTQYGSPLRIHRVSTHQSSRFDVGSGNGHDGRTFAKGRQRN